MKIIFIGLSIVLLTIIRIVEVTYQLHLVFYVHDTLLIVLTAGILLYGVMYRRSYLIEMFHRIDRMSVKIVNLSLLVILGLLMITFSVYVTIEIANYLLTTQMSQLGWALRDKLYGTHVNIGQYLIQLMPLLAYMMFFDIRKKQANQT